MLCDPLRHSTVILAQPDSTGCRYASNIGLLLMNKLLLSYTSFRRPVFLTLCHMVACVAMSGLGDITGIIQKQPIRTSQQVGSETPFCGITRRCSFSVVLGSMGHGHHEALSKCEA